MKLCDRGFPQRTPRHKERVGWQVKHSLLLWVHQSCPGSKPEQRQLLSALTSWDELQAESLPHLTGLPATMVGALPRISRARAEPEQGEAVSKERNGSTQDEVRS